MYSKSLFLSSAKRGVPLLFLLKTMLLPAYIFRDFVCECSVTLFTVVLSDSSLKGSSISMSWLIDTILYLPLKCARTVFWLLPPESPTSAPSIDGVWFVISMFLTICVSPLCFYFFFHAVLSPLISLSITFVTCSSSTMLLAWLLLIFIPWE